jgi:hypothetical protein
MFQGRVVVVVFLDLFLVKSVAPFIFVYKAESNTLILFVELLVNNKTFVATFFNSTKLWGYSLD